MGRGGWPAALVLAICLLLGACTTSSVPEPTAPTGPTGPEQTSAAQSTGDQTTDGQATAQATGGQAHVQTGEPVPTGSSERSVSVDGTDRAYRVYRPEKLADPAPLILAYHGSGGSAQEMEASTGWDQQADRSGALVIFPDGVGNTFNAGGCCGQAASDGVDDVAAALAMIDNVSSSVPVDATRVYATGFSNGGHMTYRLACDTDRFAAIAPVSGARLASCASTHGTSLLHIHGLQDDSVPVAGQTRDNGVVVPPLQQTIDGWRRALRCAAPTDSTGAGGQVRRSDATCADGRAVDLITLESFGHAWPRSGDGLDASSEIARFFAAHHR